MTSPSAVGARMQALLGSLPLSMIVLDVHGTVLAWNGHAETLFGWSAAEAVGCPVADLVVPADGATSADSVMDQLRQGRSLEGEYRVRRKDGRELTVHVIDSPLADSSGTVTGFIGLAVDVTEARRGPAAVLDAVIHNSLIDARRFQALIENTADVTSIIGADGTRLYLSPSASRQLGCTADEIAETSGWERMHPDDVPAAAAAFQSALDQPGVTVSHSFRIRHQDGRWLDVEQSLLNRADDPAIGGVVCVARDVTARRASEQRLLTLNRLGFLALRMDDTGGIFDAVVDALVPFGLHQVAVIELIPGVGQLLVRAVSGASTPLARGNVVASNLLPMASAILAGGVPVMIDDFSLDPRFDGSRNAMLLDAGSGLGVPIRVHGQTVAALTVASLAPRAFDGQDLDFYDSVAHVVSGAMERRRYEDNIRHDAMHDGLTGLPNRVLLQDRLAQALSRCRRKQSGPVAVLVADIDAFKMVNDTLGHGAGDRLLSLVGERLREAIRPSDTIARLGGDEFVVLCENLSDASEAAAVAERITERVRAAFRVDGEEVSLTVSTGVAVGGETSTDEGLLRDAEVAMYRAKETGRGRYELFDDALRHRLVHHVELEQGIRHALKRQQFAVAYQPIVDLVTGEVHEAEALLRWTREDGTPVSPAEFIPVAEEAGMIVAIGAWVLTRACEDAVRWNARLLGGPVGVAVNLSARQVGDPGLVPSVVQALHTTGLSPDLLRLEITETALMEEGSEATATLQALDDLGVRLSVDDFGTGYSSLMYLRRYPVRVLKVDRYFIAGLGRNPEDEAIVQAVIALAHSLGLRATAEGVETVEQLSRLRSLHCDSGQGYLWSKAVTLDRFIPLVGAMRLSMRDPLDEPAPITVLPPPATTAGGGPRRRVVLADDSASDRGLLRIALEESGDFTVVGEAGDGRAAIRLATDLQPDLLILDMAMPGMNGLEALGPIHRVAPATVVIFLSGFLSGALANAVTQAGAFAQFDKSVPIASLVRQLTAVLEQRPPVPLPG